MDAETIPIPQPPSPSSPLADRFVNAAPFLRAPERVRSIYTVTLLTACGPLVAGIVFFGWRAAILAGLSVATSVLLEHVYFRITRSPAMLGRSHAYLTGLLLALTLPAHAPWYVPVVGAAFAVIIGKAVFGGVGHFVWQPALVGRVAVAVMFAAVLNPSARTADAHRTLPAPGYGLLLGPTEIISGDIHLKRRAEGYDSWTDLRNRRGIDPPGVTHGISRTGHGPLRSQALFIPVLTTEPLHVLRYCPGIAMFVKGITRPAAGQERHDHIPPQMSPAVPAHRCETRIGKRVEPAVQLRPAVARGGDQKIHYGRNRFYRARFAARRLATWPWMIANDCLVSLRISCFNRRYCSVH